jgi:hypothetical protein
LPKTATAHPCKNFCKKQEGTAALYRSALKLCLNKVIIALFSKNEKLKIIKEFRFKAFIIITQFFANESKNFKNNDESRRKRFPPKTTRKAPIFRLSLPVSVSFYAAAA